MATEEDLAGVITHTNERLRRMTGYVDEALIGMKLADLQEPGAADAASGVLGVLSDDAVHTYASETRFRHRDGGTIE